MTEKGRNTAGKTAVFLILSLLAIQLVQAGWVTDVFLWIGFKISFLFNFLVDLLVRLLNELLRMFFDIMHDSLLAYPTLYPLKTSSGALTSTGVILKNFMIVLVPLYVFSVLIAGSYLVFMSHSPSGRAQAKMIFDKLLVSMIIVPLSPALYELLLKTNDVITRSIIQVITSGITQSNNIGEAFFNAISGMPVSAKIVFLLTFVYILWLALFALMTMWFRYLVCLAMGMMFPLTLFLYLHDWTKQLGTKLLRFNIIWIYTPTIMAVWLAMGVATVESASERGVLSASATPFFLMASLLMVSWAPLQMSGVLKWIGGILSSVGMLIPGGWGIALAAVGGLMQGKSPSAIASVGLKIGVSRMFGAAKKAFKAARQGGPVGRMTGAKSAVPESSDMKAAKKGPAPEDKSSIGKGPKVSGKAGTGKAAGKGVDAASKGAAKGIEAGSKAAGKAISAGGQGAGAGIGAAIGAAVFGYGAAVGAKVGGAVGKVAGKAIGTGVQMAGKAAAMGVRGAGKAASAVAKYGLKPHGALSAMGDALKAGKNAMGKTRLGQAIGNKVGSARQGVGSFLRGQAEKSSTLKALKSGADAVRKSAEGGKIAKGKDAAWRMRHPLRSRRGETRESATKARSSGGEQKASADKQVPEKSPAERQRQDETRHNLKEELSMPDRMPDDPWKGTGETLEGMDTDED
ncbi:MAG: hypothetical protein ABH834_01080 [Candidatus Altiarchaeota archaeon]